MGTSIIKKAYAKVNLDLYITGINDNGYHLIKSVMQTIDLYDTITVTKAEHSGVSSNKKEVPTGDDNTVMRVVKLMKKLYNTSEYHVDIEKNIPIAAGLGGPSADAAAVITAIDTLEGLRLSYEQKALLGVEIGADVPFLLRGGLAHCLGIGEKIEYSPHVLPGHILLVKPDFSVSTPWAYGEFDRISDISNPGEDKIIPAIKDGDYDRVCEAMHNDLEKPVIKEHAVIQKIKDFMCENGAGASLMSGSGSAVFGLFKDAQTMDNCKKEIQKSFSKIEVISTGAIGSIMENM